MRPAFSSRTNRRGAMALAPALRWLLVVASGMRHLCCDLTRSRLALDRDCAANTGRDIGWDDRRWNGCACSSLLCNAARRYCGIFRNANLLREIERMNLQIGARPDKRRNLRAG